MGIRVPDGNFVDSANVNFVIAPFDIYGNDFITAFGGMGKKMKSLCPNEVEQYEVRMKLANLYYIFLNLLLKCA